MSRLGSHGASAYALPGGHLEMGESWESCAAREVLEETGLEVSYLRFETAVNSIFAPDKHYVTIFMRGEVAEVICWPIAIKNTALQVSCSQEHIIMASDVMLWVRAQDAVAAVLEPEKCEAWIWAHYTQVPQPVFLPLKQLLGSGYSPHELATLAKKISKA